MNASTVLRRAAAVTVILGVLVGLTVTAGFRFGDEGGSPAPPVHAADLSRVSGGDVAALQKRLRAKPEDARTWAILGLAYVEQARVTADPTWYPRAEAALGRSLRLRPGANEEALTGQSALAAARHDFTAALRRAGEALRLNPYGTRAHAVRVDALVELGRYAEADRAVRQADASRPGIPLFARYAYVMELRGRPDEARRVLGRALDSADAAGDVAYLRTQLGDLEWSQGKVDRADREYAAALRASPGFLGAADGRARVLAARGNDAGALEERRALVARAPLPGYVIALGELYQSRGRGREARDQYAVMGAWSKLARANGVVTDADGVLAEADHGDPKAALRDARAAWKRRQGVHVADALAWALHRDGRDREALGYARRAVATGYRNALFRYHLGMVEKSLGNDAAARRWLRSALALNPRFSDVHAPSAKRALEELS